MPQNLVDEFTAIDQELKKSEEATKALRKKRTKLQKDIISMMQADGSSEVFGSGSRKIVLQTSSKLEVIEGGG